MYKDDFVIYSQKLAGFLMMNGVRLVTIRKDYIDETNNVFIFRTTDKIPKLIEQYKRSISHGTPFGENNI